MKKTEFRTPLLQSGAVLLAVIVVFSLIPSGDSMTVGSAIGSLIGGFFKFVLFLIALGVGIAFSIACFVGIFLAAIAIQSPDQASDMWAAFKQKLVGMVGSSCCCCEETTTCEPEISQEEYDAMKTQLSSLQQANQKLKSDLSAITTDNAQLKQDILGLSTMVDELKASEEKINAALAELAAKVEKEPDTTLQTQVAKLEEMYKATAAAMEELAGKLQALEDEKANEATSKAEQEGGIFSYIENDDDKDFFIAAVEEAVEKEMTYAQIDAFLTDNLSEELDKIIKDHPSLTKDFIRSKRN